MRYGLYCIIAVALMSQIAYGEVHSLEGTLTFRHDYDAGIKGTGAGSSPIPFPPDTLVELIKDGDVVAKALTDASGHYSISHDVSDPNDDYKLRIGIETIKWSDPNEMGLSGHKERVNVNGKYVLEHNWWMQTRNAFSFSDADPSTKTLTINAYVGDTSDSDSGITNHAATFRVIDLNKEDTDEELARKLCALLIVVDTAYREVAQTNYITWLGTMHDQDDNGQKVFCPAGIEELFTGGICWPSNFNIHIKQANGMAATAAHEFGHAVSYHTTSWGELDLADSHWPWKETTSKLAYGEGWAEFFAALFIDTHTGLMDVTNPYVAYDLAFVENSPSPSYPDGPYWKYWKGSSQSPSAWDGTDNSGEIVEGAVAQVFWTHIAGAGGFTQRMDDVWAVLREGATGAGNRNSRKTLEDFYDTWMTTYAGAGGATKRQTFRDACESHGVVFVRMWMKKIEGVSGSGNSENAVDKLWVSAKSKFQVEQMDADDLQVSECDEDVTKVSFEISKKSQDSPFSWPSVPEGDVLGVSNWDSFATDNTAGDGFWGELNASASGLGLKNHYYLVRGRAVEAGGANALYEDRLEGPFLRNDAAPHTADASGKTTAEWLELMRTTILGTKVGVHHQVKVDAVAPTVVNRKPAGN